MNSNPWATLENHLRPAVLNFHRSVGLANAVFLAMARLTGAVLGFYPFIKQLLDPKLLRAEEPYYLSRPRFG